MAASMRLASLKASEVRLTFVGHATWLIETAGGVKVATDYNDYVRPAVVPDIATMNRALYDRLGLREGDHVRVRQGGGEALLAAAVDERLPDDCMRVAAARPETAALGAMSGTVTAERVPARDKVAV